MPDAPFLIGALLIAGIWGFYLFPSLFGRRRDTPQHSTEEFDRWTHIVSDVQHRDHDATTVTQRSVVRARRRLVLTVLVLLAAGTLALAYFSSSLTWLLVSLLFDCFIALYLAMLLQLRNRRLAQAAYNYAHTETEPVDQPKVRIVNG